MSLSWKYQYHLPILYSFGVLGLITMSTQDVYKVRAPVCKKVGVMKLSLSDHALPYVVL